MLPLSSGHLFWEVNVLHSPQGSLPSHPQTPHNLHLQTAPTSLSGNNSFSTTKPHVTALPCNQRCIVISLLEDTLPKDTLPLQPSQAFAPMEQNSSHGPHSPGPGKGGWAYLSCYSLPLPDLPPSLLPTNIHLWIILHQIRSPVIPHHCCLQQWITLSFLQAFSAWT